MKNDLKLMQNDFKWCKMMQNDTKWCEMKQNDEIFDYLPFPMWLLTIELEMATNSMEIK